MFNLLKDRCCLQFFYHFSSPSGYHWLLWGCCVAGGWHWGCLALEAPWIEKMFFFYLARLWDSVSSSKLQNISNCCSMTKPNFDPQTDRLGPNPIAITPAKAPRQLHREASSQMCSWIAAHAACCSAAAGAAVVSARAVEPTHGGCETRRCRWQQHWWCRFGRWETECLGWRNVECSWFFRVNQQEMKWSWMMREMILKAIIQGDWLLSNLEMFQFTTSELQSFIALQCIFDGELVRTAFAIATPLMPLALLLLCGGLEVYSKGLGDLAETS